MTIKTKQSLTNKQEKVDEILDTQLSSALKILNGGKATLDIDIVSLDIKPEDEFEKIIASQMLIANAASMKCISDAWQTSEGYSFSDSIYKYSPEVRNQFIRSASKLMQSCCELGKALNRHRGKLTEQKITVQYLQINNS